MKSAMEVRVVTLDINETEELEEWYQKSINLVDEESKIQLNKYYHRIDSIRGLIGRLLPRLLLKEKGISLSTMSFGKTKAGKPYIATAIDPPIGYNITHDNGVVAMAFSIGNDLYPDPPAYRIGLDIMRLELPKRDTFTGFVKIFSEQLTALERNILLILAESLSQREQLRQFYLIWTLKEAYTKAMGLGMGFDFSRIEYDVLNDIVRIDGIVPRGWEFTRFELQNEVLNRQMEDYVGVVARFIGDGATKEARVVACSDPDWLTVYNAAGFLKMAIEKLDT